MPLLSPLKPGSHTSLIFMSLELNILFVVLHKEIKQIYSKIFPSLLSSSNLEGS